MFNGVNFWKERMTKGTDVYPGEMSLWVATWEVAVEKTKIEQIENFS